MDIVRGPLFDLLTDEEKTALGQPPSSLTHGVIRQGRTPRTAQVQKALAETKGLLLSAIPAVSEIEQRLKEVENIQRKARPARDEATVRGLELPPPPPSWGGGFEWVQTRVWGGNGIDVVNNGSEVSIGGEAADLGDQLVQFSVGSESYFAIPTSSLLLASTEDPPKWMSSPVVSVLGVVWGWTGIAPFIMSMGDKWAKCRLRISHDVRQVSPVGGVPPQILAQAADTWEIIDEENQMQEAYGVLDFQNSYLSPTPVFRLAMQTENVLALVSLVFEIQLEGDAAIKFHRGGSPAGEPSVRMAARGWHPHGLSRWLGKEPGSP